MKQFTRMAIALLLFVLSGQGYAQNGMAAVRQTGERENGFSQSTMGWMYHTGTGVTRDHAQAMQWYRKAADQGNLSAQYNIGVMYYRGEGVAKNDAEALKWFRKAADQGHLPARNVLSQMVAQNAPASLSIDMPTKREARANREGKAADNRQNRSGQTDAILTDAANGNADAQFNLGWMYYNGKGVKQSYQEAGKWLRKAADQGDVSAQYVLGWMCEQGRGLPQDYREAAKWFRKAAEQGDARSQYKLGTMYERGIGVPQDYQEAVKWFRKDADQGIARGQFKLGVMYERGHGVPQDYVQAHMWSSLAASQGSKDAAEYRDTLAKQMTSGQVTMAQEMLQNWRAMKR
ncbi:MAG: sel1 repeat family protein [Magnetococcus sp. YQC-3]